MNSKPVTSEDLTLFALQALPPAEASEVRAYVEQNEAARAELAEIQGDLALLALSSEMHAPPAEAREGFLRGIAKEKKIVSQQPAAAAEEPVLMPRGGRVLQMQEAAAARRSSGVLTWAGWAVAAGLGVVAGLQYHQRQVLQNTVDAETASLAQSRAEAARAQAVMQALTDGGAMQVALHLPAQGAPAPPRPEGHAAYVASTGSLVFVGSHLNPLPAQKTYELWVIPSDGSAPVPAGTFKPDVRGYASVILPELPKGIGAKMFGVTIENDGGSKIPTPPIVLAGM